MKLHLSILEKIIDLPSKDPLELRAILDDLGLEVKDILNPDSAPVFNIETLANRGDHLYAVGIAREFSARYLTPIKYPTIASEIEGTKGSLVVRKHTDKCHRYALLEMIVPPSLQISAEIGSVIETDGNKHPIVTLLNYIQLEIGQPMHAFDKDKIEGEIIIELTEREEKIVALDGNEYTVPQGSIVIKDRKKIVAVAGVIGLANSMVTPTTSKVLIESASFDPVQVRKTARAMGISTDASYLFERGCDIELPLIGLRRLIALATGTNMGSGSNSAHVVGLTYAAGETAEKRVIKFPLNLIKKQIGITKLSDIEICSRLKNLGFGVVTGQKDSDMTAVTVPSWRLWDIRNPEDLVEEFVRVHGINNVKLILPELDNSQNDPPEADVIMSRVEPGLIGSGFYEVKTKSFYSSEELKILSELMPGSESRHVQIKNAVESSYSHLKITNILHLAKLAIQNDRRGVTSIKIYELGRLFSLGLQGTEYEFELETLSLLSAGRWFENEWRKGESLADRLMLFKGVVQGLLTAIGLQATVVESKEPLLHPGSQLAFKSGRQILGHFGLLHPLIRERLDTKLDLIYAQFDVATLARVASERSYHTPSLFPAAWRDITIKFPMKRLASEAIHYALELKNTALISVAIVDDFKKEGEEFRRVSYRLTFQSPDRTLENTEVDAAMAMILQTFKDKHKLELAG